MNLYINYKIVIFSGLIDSTYYVLGLHLRKFKYYFFYFFKIKYLSIDKYKVKMYNKNIKNKEKRGNQDE